MMSGEIKDLDITGLDFPLAVNATIGAAGHIRDFDGVRTTLTMLAAHEDDRERWREEADELFKNKIVENVGMTFRTEVPADINKLQTLMKRSTLFLLPLKSDSPLFGTEALAAIAAGVPVLVSRYSGIARLLRGMAEDEPVVYGTKLQSRTDIWKDRILKRLLRPEESQRAASRLNNSFWTLASLKLIWISSMLSLVSYLHRRFRMYVLQCLLRNFILTYALSPYVLLSPAYVLFLFSRRREIPM